MKLCYVDETGTDGKSRVVIFVGVIADVLRVHRTRSEFQGLFAELVELPSRPVVELKGANLYNGNGRWRDVDGERRHQVITDLCNWLADRKHSLALSAIDTRAFPGSALARTSDLDIWMCGALHVALQIQRAHQRMKKNKGATFLVFDEHKAKGDALAELLFDPPAWTEAYYNRSADADPLDQITDTAFYARSHHVGLVQVADVFAFVLRRFTELADCGAQEGYEGELDRLTGWVDVMKPRLLPRSHRWPQARSSEAAAAYRDLVPSSLLQLG